MNTCYKHTAGAYSPETRGYKSNADKININMGELDAILELIKDSKWHSIEEIQGEVNLSSDKLNEVIRFLREQAFVDKQNESLRITPAGLRLLELPA